MQERAYFHTLRRGRAARIVISHSLVGASADYTPATLKSWPSLSILPASLPHEIPVLAKLAGMKYIVFTAKPSFGVLYVGYPDHFFQQHEHAIS